MQIAQTLSLVGIAIFLALLVWQKWQENAPEREHLATKKNLAQAGTVEPEGLDSSTAHRESLKFLGQVDVRAGQRAGTL